MHLLMLQNSGWGEGWVDTAEGTDTGRRNSITLLQGSQISAARPSESSVKNIKVVKKVVA